METEEIVLKVLKYALFGIKDPLPEGIDWEAVYEELKAQTVQNLVCPIVGELPGFGEEDKQRWIRSAGVSVPHYFKILKAQQDTVNLLSSKGIRSIILKGAAAAMYYPYPEYRSMGDIDLLIERGRAREAADFLIEKGYEIDVPLELSTRHYNLRKNGIEIEVHIHFSHFEDEKLSTYLDDMLFEAMETAQNVTSYNYSFPVLPTLENGVVLLCHINQHLISGLGLRQICDWIMYVSSVLNDGYWETQFKSVAEELGLEKMAKVFARIGQLYLGLPEDEHTWCMDADEGLCAEILNYIFKSGNFGKKCGMMSHVNNALIEIKKDNIFKVLQHRGERNFAATIARHPWTKHFIWLPQGIRTMKHGFKVIHTSEELTQAYEYNDYRFDLMDKIGYIK